MSDKNTSASLFAQFVSSFEIEQIYTVGWESLTAFAAPIMAVLLLIAFVIRATVENYDQIANGRADYGKLIANTFIIALSVSGYMFIVYLIIKIFNAFYGIFAFNSITELSTSLSETIANIRDNRKYEFDWRDLLESILGIFPLIFFMLSKLILTVTMLAAKIAHAVLLVFLAHMGAIILPMALVNGLSMLKALKVGVLFLLFWPIAEQIFTLLIYASASATLENMTVLKVNSDTYDVGLLVFYMLAFGVINSLLIGGIIAAIISGFAIASNSGGFMGSALSFAGAGMVAGGAVAKSLMPRPSQQGMSNIGQRLQGFSNRITGKNGNGTGEKSINRPLAPISDTDRAMSVNKPISTHSNPNSTTSPNLGTNQGSQSSPTKIKDPSQVASYPSSKAKTKSGPNAKNWGDLGVKKSASSTPTKVNKASNNASSTSKAVKASTASQVNKASHQEEGASSESASTSVSGDKKRKKRDQDRRGVFVNKHKKGTEKKVKKP